MLTTITTNNDGAFTLTNLPDGIFTLTVNANGFQSRQLPLSIRGGNAELETIRLSIHSRREAVTVTAQRGAVEAVEQSAQIVSIKDGDALRARPLATIGKALEGAQNRVLPRGATINGVRITEDNSRAPLYLKTAGYATANLRSSVRLTERLQLNFALMNLLDKNYRTHGSGLDAPGRNVWLALVWRF